MYFSPLILFHIECSKNFYCPIAKYVVCWWMTFTNYIAKLLLAPIPFCALLHQNVFKKSLLHAKKHMWMPLDAMHSRQKRRIHLCYFSLSFFSVSNAVVQHPESKKSNHSLLLLLLFFLFKSFILPMTFVFSLKMKKIRRNKSWKVNQSGQNDFFL